MILRPSSVSATVERYFPEFDIVLVEPKLTARVIDRVRLLYSSEFSAASDLLGFQILGYREG